jgi:HAD superfamily hydrolase (TIGR01509 family)
MPALRSISHVIFDCDGVLVDSEVLSATVLKAMMAEIGLPITDEIFRADFLGRSFASAIARAEARFGRRLPEDMQLRYRERLLAEMRGNLRPMPGVRALLGGMIAPCCLATSSSPQRLSTSLAVTDLAPYFAGRCSTASEVQHGKPAPDLLFLAARRMMAEPERCLVIEDSIMGVEAALNAKMQVIRFMGGSHMRREDSAETPPSIAEATDMAALRAMLGEAGLCSAPHPGWCRRPGSDAVARKTDRDNERLDDAARAGCDALRIHEDTHPEWRTCGHRLSRRASGCAVCA